MSGLEQERAITVINDITFALRTQKMSNVQLDMLQVAEHLLVNLAFQVQTSNGIVPEPVVDYSICESVDVTITCLSGEDAGTSYQQRATVIDKVEQGGVAEYRTTATGSEWLTAERISKVKK